ncbi:MAG TPA: radical SAM protein [Symbiobacteriaceae bacterium]|nr:radical SAM protein [Symbiobacteriaceae bacterium]
MLVEVTGSSLRSIKNPRLRSYAAQYVEIAEQFAGAVRSTGLDFDPADHRAEAAARRQALQARGAVVRNGDCSIYVNRISPACLACRKGIGSLTFFVSLQCHRNCFYCFNPNQEEYDTAGRGKRDVVAELAQIAAGGMQLNQVGLTGGEPLLHPEESIAFFQKAKELFPSVYTRLYTSGDHVTPDLLGRLKEAGLDEIRFSVRSHDGEQGRRHTYKQIALARDYIPYVMVETPVLPGTLEIMKEMLRELERLQIFGVNLLEFCYPLTNAQAYQERSYQVKNPPYRTLYNYWYAGGLPIARSELDCLELLAFMQDEQMSIGGHYCSLENKHTGQIFQQHWGQDVPPTAHVSERDFFYRTAKAFGDDVHRVRKALDKAGQKRYTMNQDYRYIEFHPADMDLLKQLPVEVAISTLVVEQRPEGAVLRELKVDLTTPQAFDPTTDL